MVHIAGSLPKGDANGLEAHEAVLVKSLASETKYFVVGVVQTDSVKTKAKDLMPDPTVAFSQIELIADGSELEAAAAALLQAAGDERRGGRGQQSFDLPAEGEAGEPVQAALGVLYEFELRADLGGVFTLLLNAGHIAGVEQVSVEGEGLLEYVGSYVAFGELPDVLAGPAEGLIAQWESRGAGDVVDAEIVEDGQ